MQISIFDGQQSFKITKPIRLIELFAGYGSQAFALKYLGVKFESWKICEWAVKSIQAYKDAHCSDDTTDYSKDLTKNQLIEYLANKGVSYNYNEPMTYEQVKRLGEGKLRTIYNNIQATHNLVNIQQAKGEDLGITDTDNYCYVMTYSFPCQDLSLAGKQAGMEKGTRSGMLWEVERILDELNGNLPQVLLMENVPEVIGSKNINHFAKWLEKLESLGYKCYWQVLNAKDYGIPQNRERCFMVSILGDYYYEFPQKIKLEHKLKDILEENVDGKYYLSSDKIKNIQNWKAQQDPLKNIDKIKTYSPTLTARGAGEERSGMILINQDLYFDTYQYSKSDNFMKGKDRFQPNKKISDTLQTTQKEGIVEFGGYNIGKVLEKCHIRKFTPKECFRLMGVKDFDFENIAINQSDASLYHLAGDSIVVDVLMHIFNNLTKY